MSNQEQAQAFGIPICTSRFMPRGTVFVVNPLAMGFEGPHLVGSPDAVWKLRVPSWFDRFAETLEGLTTERLADA